MVAGDAQYLVPPLLQLFEEMTGFAKLLGACALGEIAANDDEVGFQLVDFCLDRLDDLLVVCAEMQVGEMDEASHGL